MAKRDGDIIDLEADFDASDAQQVSRRKRQSLLRKSQDENVLNTLLTSDAGSDWLYRLLERCHMFSLSFVQGDAYASAFKEGERNIGLSIVNDLAEANPEAFASFFLRKRSNG